MTKFSTRILNLWLISLSTVISALSVHGLASEDIILKGKELALANSTLTEAERRMLAMGLKKSHNVRYSRASWYGGYFHGRTTANMEIYNKNLLTCAHKTLPLNTFLLVRNLNNEKEVIVRVNDRGPYVYGRDIDLSEAASKIIGSYKKGVVPIRYEVLVKA